MPNIVQLQRFVAVAEELNFRRAAARLHISQPPISDSVRQLEAELGAALFHRTRRSVELTKAGDVFLEKSRLVLSQLDEAVDEARSVAQGMSGRLAVGFSPTMSYNVLPRVLRRFRKRFPNVSFRFEELATSEQEDALQDKHVDVGLFHAPAVNRSGIRQETFWTEPLLVVLSDDHALTRENEIQLAQLKNEPFIFIPPRWGTGYHARVTIACQEAGFTPDVIQEVDRVHTLVALVATGMGVALCPASLRSFAPPGATFRELSDPLSLFSVEFGISWREQDQSPICDAFRDVAQEVGRAAEVAQSATHTT